MNQPNVAPQKNKSMPTRAPPAIEPPRPTAATGDNQAIQAMLRNGHIQAKLTISHPGDADELEADRVADQVMRKEQPGPIRSSPNAIHRQCAACEAGGTMCPKCEQEQAIQRNESPSQAPQVSHPVRSQIAALRGGGQPLPPSVRAFFEPQFGEGLNQVHIHTDSEASEAAMSIQADAFTIGSDIVFGAGKYAPEVHAGRKLLAHELTHVIQQGHGNGTRVQRQGTAVPASRNLDVTNRIQNAIAERNADHASLIAALGTSDVLAASTDERMSMIDILLDFGTFRQKFKIPEIWESFGKGIVGVANIHADRWKRSFEVAAEHMRTSNVVAGERTYFLSDVEDIARGYLDQNEKFCKEEMTRLGLGENGELLAGPPTVDQASALASMRVDASKISAAQEAMGDLRSVKVGYEVVSLPPGGTGPLILGTPTFFDPVKPPNFPLPENEPNRKTWEDVKKVFDDLDTLIQTRLKLNPGLYPLIRGAKEDPTKTGAVAGGSSAQALTTIGSGLRETLENIAKTRPMIHTVAPDLEPIHAQLLTGTMSVGARNWKTVPFYETLGRDIEEQHKPGAWWVELGLMGAQMGVYVVAGLATGGAALAIGLAAKGLVDVAVAQARADALEAAAKTNVKAETALVREGQVDEAKADVLMAAAFALIDVVTAAGEVRSVLRSVLQYEREAAIAAARAAAAADKDIAKESAKDVAARAIQAKTAAAEARTAANNARSLADTADSTQAARSSNSAREAIRQAELAERSAADVAAIAFEAGEDAAAAAKHAPVTKVGQYSIKARGNRIVRCINPCVDEASSIAERAAKSAEELSNSGLPDKQVAELRAHLKSINERGQSVASRAEAELAGLPNGDPRRIPIEKRLQEEAAPLERELQAIETRLPARITSIQELPPSVQRKLENTSEARKIISSNPQALQLVARHGEAAVKVLEVFPYDGVQILQMYERIAHIKGSEKILKRLGDIRGQAQGARGELMRAEELLSQGVTVERVADAIGGKEAADLVLKGNIIEDTKEFTGRNWERWMKLPSFIRNSEIKRMIKQVALRREQYPGATIRYVFYGPVSPDMVEALEKNGVEVLLR